MTRSEIIRDVSIQTGVSMRGTAMVYDAIFAEMVDAIIRGESVRVEGFFLFETFDQKGRKYRDVYTGEISMLEPSKRVRCKISKSLKDAVKKYHKQ